ncbi:hypothetical protein GCM10011499_04360 [Pelagibacterium lentulum]|uniref:Uncharacterized protein n=1 Tax=Pelagibacterium lentulum TaxID=2029865 RepID=A0A916VU66_9HYPH|nr:hypothetical protein GCM10011499_04360 [Pelagibacterium lentulum]
MTGQRLVYGVIDNLIDHMVQPGAVIGIPDIHARALPDRIKTLEDLDRIRTVFRVFEIFWRVTHAKRISLV